MAHTKLPEPNSALTASHGVDAALQLSGCSIQPAARGPYGSQQAPACMTCTAASGPQAVPATAAAPAPATADIVSCSSCVQQLGMRVQNQPAAGAGSIGGLDLQTSHSPAGGQAKSFLSFDFSALIASPCTKQHHTLTSMVFTGLQHSPQPAQQSLVQGSMFHNCRFKTSASMWMEIIHLAALTSMICCRCHHHQRHWQQQHQD